MFDVGFSELVVIFVLALIVLGPERLPTVARQIGQWTGKARRMARTMSAQFQEELNAVDPRPIIDPPPAAPPDYSRPGADELKPGAAPHDEAGSAEPPARAPSGDTRS